MITERTLLQYTERNDPDYFRNLDRLVWIANKFLSYGMTEQAACSYVLEIYGIAAGDYVG